MIDLIKKTLLTGVGLAVMTKDKVEELGRDLADQAKLGEQEGREFVESLMKQSENARGELETRIDGLVKQAVDRLNLAPKDELVKLQARILELEAQLQAHKQGADHHTH